jgi:hypothetical protein
MKEKHACWTATCAMPSSAEKHAKRLISRQHATSLWLAGRHRILNSANELEVVPSSTKSGDNPSEERRAMMR